MRFNKAWSAFCCCDLKRPSCRLALSLTKEALLACSHLSWKVTPPLRLVPASWESFLELILWKTHGHMIEEENQNHLYNLIHRNNKHFPTTFALNHCFLCKKITTWQPKQESHKASTSILDENLFELITFFFDLPSFFLGSGKLMLAKSSRGFGDSKQVIIRRNLYYYSPPVLYTPLIPKVNY